MSLFKIGQSQAEALKRCQYLPPLATSVNPRTRDAAAAGSRRFYFSFYFSSIAKSAGGFVCQSGGIQAEDENENWLPDCPPKGNFLTQYN
jgi:hypothetical protein